MGFLDSSFNKTISTPIPADIPTTHFQLGVDILQNYENVARLSTNCTGCKQVPSPPKDDDNNSSATQIWEVSEDLPFIPSWLWSGGTTYQATVTPIDGAGCEVKIRASSLYTSSNQWRVVRGSPPEDDEGMQLPGSEVEGSEWFIQTASETVCSRTFAGFVKGNLVKGTRGMHEKFIEKLREEVGRKDGGGRA